MPIVWKQVWKCGICGYEWIPRQEEKPPERCPNPKTLANGKKCRSRKWNESGSVSDAKSQSGSVAVPKPKHGEKRQSLSEQLRAMRESK